MNNMVSRTRSKLSRNQPRDTQYTIPMQTSHQIRLLLQLLLVTIMTTRVQVVTSYAVVPDPPVVLPKNTYTLTKRTAPQTTKIRYNLGIRPSSDHETTDDIISTTQYWVEYESVNEYPSPLEPVQQSVKSDTTSLVDQHLMKNGSSAPKKEKKLLQHVPLIPSRLTDDKVLKILSPNRRKEDHPSSFNTDKNDSVVKVIAHPTMRSGHDFDINTAWIELLIHEQQTKLLSKMDTIEAAATAI